MGDGIEAQLFKVLKDVYRVVVQAYHGGSLTGKDIQKVMANSGEIFSIFAQILKQNAKTNCDMTYQDIDNLCHSYTSAFLLWDGAFSYASTIDPTEDDIKMYTRYVMAAANSHVQMGCSVTPKVHLMWRHVEEQMKTIPGGLGKKREDWVEQLHQLTSVKRKQFASTRDQKQRATAISNSYQQETASLVVQHLEECNHKTSRGPRKGNVKVEEQRRGVRIRKRAQALQEWEDEVQQKIFGYL